MDGARRCILAVFAANFGDGGENCRGKEEGRSLTVHWQIKTGFSTLVKLQDLLEVQYSWMELLLMLSFFANN